MKTQMMQLADQVAKNMYTISIALRKNDLVLAHEELEVAQANLAVLRQMLEEEAGPTDEHPFH